MAVDRDAIAKAGSGHPHYEARDTMQGKAREETLLHSVPVASIRPRVECPGCGAVRRWARRCFGCGYRERRRWQ